MGPGHSSFFTNTHSPLSFCLSISFFPLSLSVLLFPSALGCYCPSISPLTPALPSLPLSTSLLLFFPQPDCPKSPSINISASFFSHLSFLSSPSLLSLWHSPRSLLTARPPSSRPALHPWGQISVQVSFCPSTIMAPSLTLWPAPSEWRASPLFPRCYCWAGAPLLFCSPSFLRRSCFSLNFFPHPLPSRLILFHEGVSSKFPTNPLHCHRFSLMLFSIFYFSRSRCLCFSWPPSPTIYRDGD